MADAGSSDMSDPVQTAAPAPAPKPSVADIRPPQALCIDQNTADEWKLCKEKWRLYTAFSLTKDPTKQPNRVELLRFLGNDLLRVYNGFKFDTPDSDRTVQEIIEHFDNYHAIGEVNETYERFQFHRRKQQYGETFEMYLAALLHLLQTCNFCQTCKDGILRDRIVLGIKESTVQTALLRERQLTLINCIDLCKAAENATQHHQAMTTDTVHTWRKESSMVHKHKLVVMQGNSNPFMNVRNMMLALLHEICLAYEKYMYPGQSEKMFRLICQEMSKRHICPLQMLPHQSIINALLTVQTAYTKKFRQMMQTVLDHLHNDSESEGIVYPFVGRYENSFDQLELLGRGSFGEVYKVKRKLDDQCYAVKKIKLAHMSTKKLEKLINEVKILSRLKHPNVVGYNTSWIEVKPVQSPSPRNSGLLRDSDSSQKGQSSSSESPWSSSELDSSSMDKSRPDDPGSGDGEEGARMAMVSGNQPWKARAGQSASFRLVLCIQMQLCSHTLSDWLNTRNQETQQAQYFLDVVDREGNMRIFKQILDGMHYIHSNGLIHRDLKPTNIFLENSGAHLKVLIGDFGLAKEDVKADDLMAKPGSHDPSPDYHEDQADCVSGCGRKSAANTADVGTLNYASPEQLQGSKYDCRADMYSSGIILLEMFHPFSTQMGRYKAIEAVRGGHIPVEVKNRWPDQCQTICQLTHANCYKRPSADQVLKGPLFKSKDEVIRDLETKLSERDLEIQRLKRQIESLQMGKE